MLEASALVCGSPATNPQPSEAIEQGCQAGNEQSVVISLPKDTPQRNALLSSPVPCDFPLCQEPLSAFVPSEGCTV